jgi:hypothetical protein
MAEYTFPCPHCGADAVGLKIVWTRIATCGKCGQPILKSAGAFATNCMAFSTVFGWLLLGLPATGLFFYKFATLGFGMRVFLAIMLPILGAIIMGQLVFVAAYLFSPFRPLGTAKLPEARPGNPEPLSEPPFAERQSFPAVCPKCGVDLRGAEIPAGQRGVFGGATHFGRVVGIYSHEADAAVAWQCPDCAYEWERVEPLSFGLRAYPLIARFSRAPDAEPT